MKAQKSNKQIALGVSVVTIIVNCVLSLGKFIAGVVAKSSAMISDAIHSASDVFSTFLVMVGVVLSSKKADKEHPYGHERFECIVAILLAGLLFATGVGIGWSAIEKIIALAKGETIAISKFLYVALFASIISIVTKEWMYWYTRSAAKKTNSDSLMADAWHHRSDSLSSIGSLIGIGGSMLGFPICDPIASIIICVFIVKVAIDIFKDAIGKVTDKTCDEKLTEQFKKSILSQEGVITIDLLQARLFGNRIYVDVEIGVDKNLILEDAHHIATNVHDALEKDFPQIKHCMVHVNPR